MQRSLTNYIPKSFTSFDGASIYYEITEGNEKKPTLLFIHGLGGDLTAWDQERLYLSQKGYGTIALDLRGHGLSKRSSQKNFYALDKFAHDILVLNKTEKLKNVFVIGHCFGGVISLILEGKYKMEAKGLILVDTDYKANHFTRVAVDSLLIQFLASLFSKLPNIGISGHTDFRQYIGTTDFDKKRILSDILHTSLESYLLIFSNILKFDGEELLKAIDVPTLIIEGENDSVVTPDIAKILHQKISASALKIIPKANHIIVFNNPRELSEAIHSFCEETFFLSQ